MIEALYTNLNWREPLWLLLLLQPLVVFVIQRSKRINQLNCYADQKLHAWVTSPKHRRLGQHIMQRKFLFLIAWILFSLAMAGPRSAQEIPGEAVRSKLDIMIAVDLSRSMRAADVQPDRLKRVQIELHEFLRQSELQASPHQISMLVYAARPHLYFPPTADRQVIEFYLNSLDGIRLPTHGSNIVAALQMSINELAQKKSAARAILLLTDGDFNLNETRQQQLNSILTDLENKGIPLYILGVGSVEGEAIPLAEGGWLADHGNAVVSHMNESLLSRMAAETNGKFQMVTDDASDWQSLYTNGLSSLQSLSKADLKSDNIIWYEYYPWLLLPALLLLFLASLPFRIIPSRNLRHIRHLTIIISMLPLMLYPFDNMARASELHEQREAALLFQNEQYKQARDLYKTFNGYEARFGEGASRYRLGDYAGAIQQFSQAVLETSDPRQRATALYNLANSYYQSGNYQTAVEVYNDVLRYQPGNQASIKNRDVSLILLQQIEERIQLEKAARAGSGAASGAAAEGINLSESSRVSIGDEESKQGGPMVLPGIPNMSNKVFEELVQKGVRYARLADSASPTENQSVWQQQQYEARFQMQALEDNKAKHIQRLFEMEEGFAAPVEKPVDVPGEKPW